MKAPSSMGYQVTIYNLLGQKVNATEMMRADGAGIALHHLEPGVYFYRVRPLRANSQFLYTGKFTIR